VADKTKRIVVFELEARGTVAKNRVSMREVQLPSVPLMMICVRSEVKLHKLSHTGVKFTMFEGTMCRGCDTRERVGV